ncbi:hypothetical protein QO198_18575 [Pseudoalteromonas distincta]|uniref:hypothetical protein n=1 Tax=Pseudoalteromonas distincta TaxID=77608 RepID=UPI00352F6BB1
MEQLVLLLNSLSLSAVTAFTSLLVAICAMFITFWQAHLSRKHNKLSVKPHIAVHKVAITGKTPEIRIINKGVGPAFINSINLNYNNEFFSFRDIESIERLLLKLGYPKTNFYRALIVPSIISVAANSEVELLAFPTSDKDTNFELNKKLIKKLINVKINIEYSCIYEGKYSTSS